MVEIVVGIVLLFCAADLIDQSTRFESTFPTATAGVFLAISGIGLFLLGLAEVVANTP